MSWKNNPKIRDLEPYAKKHNYSMVVVMAIREDGKQYDVTTYGRNKSLCVAAALAGKQLNKLVQSGKWPNWPDKKPANIEGDNDLC